MSTSTLGGLVNTISNQQAGPRRRSRLHSDEFKAEAVAACAQPGMSMAAVAMSTCPRDRQLVRLLVDMVLATQLEEHHAH